MSCTRYVVSGRVQGVFYRATTRDIASELGLVGWVRNQAEGSVELLACGSNESLNQLERWLWDGPKFADVTAVSVEPNQETNETFIDFAVRY